MPTYQEELTYYQKYLKEHPESTITKEEVIKRLSNGEPIQYILGEVNFYGYPIKVTKDVLIPRYETELLVEKTITKIKKHFSNTPISIIDLGTGTGCIPITLKKELPNDTTITALDISNKALVIAKNNAKLNDAEINFILHDMTTYIEGKYDVIISNPPYIKYDEPIMDIVKNNEPHQALYASDNGIYFYKKIIDNLPHITKDKYLIAFEIGYEESTEIVNYIKSKLSNVTISIEKDYQDRDRFIFITNIKLPK